MRYTGGIKKLGQKKKSDQNNFILRHATKTQIANKLPSILPKPKVEILTFPPQTNKQTKNLEKYLLIQWTLLIT